MTNQKQQGFTLIEVLIVMGIVAVLATIVIVAINPGRQFAQARNLQRTSNVNAILNAIGQYVADNKGAMPAEITTTEEDISSAEANICAILVPTYMPALTSDPAQTAAPMDDGQITSTECGGVAGYNTGYTVVKDANGRITIKAPAAELGVAISVTR